MTDHRAKLIEALATVAETFMANGMNVYETIAVADGVLRVETYTATGEVEHTYTVDLSQMPLVIDGQPAPVSLDIDHVELFYQKDSSGEHPRQGLAEIVEVGTPIDPETGDDLMIEKALLNPSPKALRHFSQKVDR